MASRLAWSSPQRARDRRRRAPDLRLGRHGVMLPAMSYFDAIAKRYPGESGARQPVHTVYGGAHLFTPTPRRSSASSRSESLDEHAPDAATFARGDRHSRASSRDGVYERVRREAATASRSRTSASTSRTATASAPTTRRTATPSSPRSEVARGHRRGHAAAVHRHPHQAADRASSRARSAAHARRLPRRAARATSGRLPANFVVTLPKIQHVERRARRSSTSLETLEERLGLAPARCRIEIMVESHADDLRPDGRVDAAALHDAAAGASSARTSAPTTTPRAATSPPRTSTCATRRATSRST